MVAIKAMQTENGSLYTKQKSNEIFLVLDKNFSSIYIKYIFFSSKNS